MPPALAAHFIQIYSSSGDLILDPFCGKGTVLLEAVLRHRRALGFDVAPDAVIVSNAKVDPPTLSQATELVKSLRISSRTRLIGIPRSVRTFFSARTLRGTIAVRDQLLKISSNGDAAKKRTAGFLLGTLLGILHGHSRLSLSLPCSHSFAMAPRYVKRYAKKHRLTRPDRDVKRCLLQRVKQLLSAGNPPVRGKARWSSAENLRVSRRSLSSFVDLIITSPPYLDAQTYAKDSWLRLWLLGYDHRMLLPKFIQTGSPKKYKEKMLPCLKEMLRVLKPKRYAVVVAGDVPYEFRRKKKIFRTASELARLAAHVSHDGHTFRRVLTIRDDIPSHLRYYSSVHKDNNSMRRKGILVERIVVLRKVRSRS